jgi:uncharacterized protein (DUF1697 family)
VSKQIALLRAVNLGAHNKVGMAELRALLADLGFKDAQSLLQSGNLVFAAAKPAAEVEALLERETKRRLGLDTDFFVRTAKDWQGIVAGNPFPAEAKADPGHLVVVCLKDAPAAKAVAALQAAAASKGREQVRASGRTAYVTYPDGIGRSKLTAQLIERHLGSPGTARNWNTVLKLAAAVQAP